MKKSKLPSVVSILILTLITAIVWVTFDVYRLFNKTPDPVVPENVSKPLDPNLDIDVIKEIRSRNSIDESLISDQVVSQPIKTDAPAETVIETSEGEQEFIPEESPIPEDQNPVDNTEPDQ